MLQDVATWSLLVAVIIRVSLVDEKFTYDAQVFAESHLFPPKFLLDGLNLAFGFEDFLPVALLHELLVVSGIFFDFLTLLGILVV